MRRSEINGYIREAKEFIKEMNFFLPPFAFWSPEDWRQKGSEYGEIRKNQLGWDLTDFGGGSYEKLGLFLFTIRNGNTHHPSCKKTYAEKILLVRPGQLTPYHFHRGKMEDIINRGGKGPLNVQVYCSAGEKELDRSSRVPVAVDGRNYLAEPGSVIRLLPGESITLFQGVFHQFWPEDAQLLLGEVSMVNDDHADNFFLEERGRFPDITEDEAPLHLLVSDYGK
ncbi:MAG: D-lyxose/D-mannose family sugar isomerase [Treponema sp.]|jgi:D-lyxose ketol-isomerase|nr:D-lyxose/D-mannose family sugar isomerase [Treponema sp.]